MKLLSIVRSERKGKRYKAIFDDGTTTHFGQDGGSTFIDHQDEDKRKAYIARHSKNNEDWSDPTTPGALARFILWERPSLREAVKTFKKRFSV
jgi:hypothetical protein